MQLPYISASHTKRKMRLREAQRKIRMKESSISMSEVVELEKGKGGD